MVDIKRLNDLLVEYNDLGVAFPGYKDTLQKVLADASTWSTSLERSLTIGSPRMDDCLVVLERESQTRPSGLIMDPTRQVLETILDLL